MTANDEGHFPMTQSDDQRAGTAVSGKLDEAPRKSASACEVAAYYPAMLEYVTALEQHTSKAEKYLALQSRIAISAHTRMEKAESLAKAERSQRESEAEAYRKEIAELREAVEVADIVAKMAAHDRDEALVQLAAAAGMRILGVDFALPIADGEQRMSDAVDATKRIQDERDA